MIGYRLQVTGDRLKLILVSVLFFLFTITCILLPRKIYAQAINLSISPPLFELMIQPNKQVKQIFTITNLGGDSIITPSLVYFEPSDETGNVNLTENQVADWVIYNQSPFNLKGQEKFDFEVSFSPSTDVPEIDHFLTIIFETSESVDLLNQNSSNFKSQIGANILLTVSKDGNPKKSAEIIDFATPKIIDSLFGKISYQIKLKNTGNSYWKPNGKIIVNDIILNLAPQNILSGYSRNISCINDQTLASCDLKDRFYLGKITAKLEFSIDEDPKIYQKEATSYSFPFSILGFLIFLLTTIKTKLIFKLWPRKRH